VRAIDVVVADAMVFSYLQGLGRLDLLLSVSVATGKIAVTKAVLGQLLRSGQLGPLVLSYCDRGEVQLFTPRLGDEVSEAVASTLRRKESRRVGRNRVDIEIVEQARTACGAVLGCRSQHGRVAHRRSVGDGRAARPR
jgi:hypothetical protein